MPLSIIIQQCGGQRNFKMTCIEEVLLTALPLAMEQAVKQEGVVPDSERVRAPRTATGRERSPCNRPRGDPRAAKHVGPGCTSAL